MRGTVVFVLLAASIWGASAVATAGSGLYGVVRRGPITPVCQVGVPCDEPARGVTLVFRRAGDGRIVGRVTTRRDGGYRIALPAGTYTIRQAKQPPVGFGIRPALVRVRRLRWERVDFFIDTGIR